MAEMREARAPEHKKEASKKMHHMRIHPMKGGHLVTHHAHSMEPYGMEHEEKPYHKVMFGKDDGEELMRHVMKHGKVELAELKDEEEGHPEAEGESRSEEDEKGEN